MASNDFSNAASEVQVKIKDNVPKVADYDPQSITIKLDTRGDNVLASVYSTIRSFTHAVGGGDRHERIPGDVIKEYDASEFEDKFGDSHITFDQFYEDARKAQEILDHRPEYQVGDDDVNLNDAQDIVSRYKEIERDMKDYQAEYIEGLEKDTPGIKIAPENIPEVKLPGLGS